MAENKIKYGLKSVYYAVATIAANGSATYDTPVAFPGAVSISLDPQGDNEPFYADNIVYWVGANNQGYEGDLEMARLSEDFKKDCLGYIEDDNGVLIEDVNAEAVHFALLFQFEGDQNATRHVFYNCTATRAAASGNTKGESIEPATESVTIRATSVFFSGVGANGADIVKGESASDTDSTTYNAWYTTVYTPSVT